MSRRRRPLAALGLIADGRLISACGSSAPAGTGTAAAAAQHCHRQCSEGGEVRRVHAQQRGQRVPGPGASGKFTIDGIANGSSLDPNTPAFTQAISACKDLEPAGFTGSKRSSQQTAGRAQVRPVHPRQRRDGLPGPRQWQPLVDTNRIPSAATSGGMSILNAAMQKCRDFAAAAAGVTGEAEDLGAGRSGRPGCRDRHRRRGRHVRRQATGPGRTAAAGEHRAGGEQDALGDGLPGRDPDLSGAIGRLAVLRDQPGPRDIHQAARGRPGDLSGSRALPGERPPGGVAVRLDTRLSDPVGRGDRPRRGRAQRGSGRARLRHPGSARAQRPPPSGRPPPRPWRSSRPPWG